MRSARFALDPPHFIELVYVLKTAFNRWQRRGVHKFFYEFFDFKKHSFYVCARGAQKRRPVSNRAPIGPSGKSPSNALLRSKSISSIDPRSIRISGLFRVGFLLRRGSRFCVKDA